MPLWKRQEVQALLFAVTARVVLVRAASRRRRPFYSAPRRSDSSALCEQPRLQLRLDWIRVDRVAQPLTTGDTTTGRRAAHTTRQDHGTPRGEEDVDEIATCCADVAAAWFIEPTTWHQVAEAGTDPSWGRPKRAGKAPCGVSGTGTQATGW